MYDVIFAPSWYFLAGAFVFGIVFLLYALRRGVSAQRNVALAVLLAAAIWAALDSLVTTPSEAATRGTKQFVAAVVARDKDKMRSLLSTGVSLTRLGRDEIVLLVPKYADDWKLTSAIVTDTQVEDRGGEVSAAVHIFSRHENGQFDTIPSDWQFIWIKEGDEWHITQIVPIKVGTADLQSIKDRYFGTGRK